MAFNDFKTKRPSYNHPDSKYWEDLKKSVLEDQNQQCATCPSTAEDYPLDLHHRHYNNFGKEDKNDVVILCRPCHDAITSRLRAVREKEDIKHLIVEPLQAQERIVYEKPRF